MTTLLQAIDLAKKDKADGHIIGWCVTEGALWVESDQGWRLSWPCDPNPDNSADCWH